MSSPSLSSCFLRAYSCDRPTAQDLEFVAFVVSHVQANWAAFFQTCALVPHVTDRQAEFLQATLNEVDRSLFATWNQCASACFTTLHHDYTDDEVDNAGTTVTSGTAEVISEATTTVCKASTGPNHFQLTYFLL